MGIMHELCEKFKGLISRFKVWRNKCSLYDSCDFKDDEWFRTFYCLNGRYEECIIYENTKNYYG